MESMLKFGRGESHPSGGSTAGALETNWSIEEGGNRPVHVISTVVRGSTDEEVSAIAKTVESVCRLARTLIASRYQTDMTKLVDAVVPKIVPSPTALAEAEMLIRAKTEVLNSGDLVTSAEIAKMAGFSDTNASSSPNRWKQDKKIFALTHGGVDYYPAYALDPDQGYRPRKAIAEVLKVFDGSKSGWGLAFWFSAVNSYLGGRRPQDLIATNPAAVLDAAHWEAEPITHG